MHISYRDFRGREIDYTCAPDGERAVYNAMSLLARQRRLNAGDTLIVDDDSSTGMAEQIVTATDLVAIAGRLERRAGVVATNQPALADDLRKAAGMCRSAVRCWLDSGVDLVA